jgi:hypothetical protein
MHCVLDGLGFPAGKWRILAQADLNGVDNVTRERLRGLSEGIYRDSGAVASVLDQGPPGEGGSGSNDVRGL